MAFLKSCLLIFCITLFPLKAKTEDEAFPYKSNRLKSLGFLKKDTFYYNTPVFKNLSLIYSEDFKEFAPFLSDYIKQIDIRFSKVFQNRPYFKQRSIVFLSSQTQTPMAYTTMFPSLGIRPFNIVMHPSFGAYFMDQWSVFHWSQDSLIHEMTHLYQFSQNSTWDRGLWWAMLFDIFSHRNIMLSRFVLEGSAILNESIYGSGGRLFSGWVRAFVLSQLKQGFSLKRLLRPYNDSYSIIEKYLHGGYFFAYLHSKYKEKKSNHFFSKSGHSFPWDFYGLDLSSKKAFGKGIESLFEDYKQHYAPLAEKQISSSEKTLLKSKVYAPINSNKDKIYFLTYDEKSPPYLILFDKETKNIQKRKKKFPHGKVFYRKGEYYSSGYGKTGSFSTEYSLFKTGFKPVKKYNSQHIMDFYGNKYISLDTRQSHSQNSLLVNGAFYDTTASSAIMDHLGRVYYFKQNKGIRTLYRDKVPLFSFKSYFSYPVEADEEGLYFIGATEYGSSLFIYEEDFGVSRLSESDTISYARKIKNNEFMVSEIGPTHHEYKIIQTQKTPEQPFLYTYSFEKDNLFEEKAKVLPVNLEQEQENTLKPTALNDEEQNIPNFEDTEEDSEFELALLNALDEQQIELENTTQTTEENYSEANTAMAQNSASPEEELFQIIEKEHFQKQWKHNTYNSLSNLSLQPITFYAWIWPLNKNYNLHFLSKVQFMDPLRFNQFSLNNVFIPQKYFSFQMSYTYMKYRPSLDFSFAYNQKQKSKSSLALQEDIRLKAALIYPLIIKNQWTLSLTKNVQLGQERQNEKHSNKDFPVFFNNMSKKAHKNYIQHGAGINYSFKRKYKHAYSFYKKRALKLSYSVRHIEEKPRAYKTHLSGQMEAYFTEEIGEEWFVSLNGAIRRNLQNQNLERLLLRNKDTMVLHYNSFKQNVQHLYELDFQILKALNWSYYPLKLPLALRQLAPLAGLSFLSIKEKENKKYNYFFVPFAGIESDINILHETIILFKAGFSGEYVFNLSNPKIKDFKLSAWLKGSF